MPVTLAFYKAKGNIADKIIRFFTASKYSHVEIVTVDSFGNFTGYTSSPRDGGVVVRALNYDENNWDLFVYEFADEASALDYIMKRRGMKYDWMNIIFHHFINLGIHSRDKVTCSEIVAAAIGLNYAWKYSPGSLYNKVVDMHNAYGLNS